MVYVLCYKLKFQWFFSICSLSVNMFAVDTHFGFFRIVKNYDILGVSRVFFFHAYSKKKKAPFSKLHPL